MESDGAPSGALAMQFADLSRALFAARDLDAVLVLITSATTEMVEGAELASITLRSATGELSTPAYTDELALRVDEIQYDCGEGPCVQVTAAAVLSASAVDLAGDERWPGFGPAAADEGVKAVLSVALLPPSATSGRAVPPLGALNLYARSAHAFSSADYDTALLLAAHAAIAIDSAAVLEAAGAEAERLTGALSARDVIGQAKGILMERHDLTESEAFHLLQDASDRLNITLRDLAFSIAEAGPDSPHAPTPEPRGQRNEREWLRRIEAVTDTSLSRLGVEELLLELLDRVRDALQVDTAAVLLLDRSTDQLVATAARGIEEEVRQGVRIPLGAGFAGRVAAEGRPVALDEVTEYNVVNPTLRGKNIRSLLGVPLIAAGSTVGVLHVGTTTPRHFTDADAEFLQLVGDRVALSVSSQITGVERVAARTLARSLIPSRLPAIDGLELGARYIPGEDGGVGGDWYDVFVLPDGKVGVAIGDVTGHGLSAAVVMGRLRSALRAYALHSSDPGEVLQNLDAKIQHFEPGAMATVCYATFDPGLDRLEVSLAGHFPPITAVPHQSATVAQVAVDPPLGVRRGLRRRTTSLPVVPGELICLYTDGLIERRGSDIDADMDRLREHLVAGPPEWICQTVTTGLLGAEKLNDDVAMLVIRRTP